jgi:uncharacterized protein YjbI with pentapeptide repeats
MALVPPARRPPLSRAFCVYEDAPTTAGQMVGSLRPDARGSPPMVVVWLGLVVFVVILAVALGRLAYAIHRDGWSYVKHQPGRWRLRTGFQGKTVWDWLQLLIVPLVLALVAFMLNNAAATRDRAQEDARTAKELRQTRDRDREVALSSYFQQMSQLITAHGLRSFPGISTEDRQTDAQTLGRTLTLTVLRRLDGKRKALVLHFLVESELIDSEHFIDPAGKVSESSPPKRQGGLKVVVEGAAPRISLAQADLRGIDFRHQFFGHTAEGLGRGWTKVIAPDLTGADLREADLREAALDDVILEDADLQGADLRKATVEDASFAFSDLRQANLSGALLERTTFDGACLTGAIFQHAILSDADFGEATGSRVDFFAARLDGADFRHAGLTGIDLREARTHSGNGTSARVMKVPPGWTPGGLPATRPGPPSSACRP